MLGAKRPEPAEPSRPFDNAPSRILLGRRRGPALGVTSPQRASSFRPKGLAPPRPPGGRGPPKKVASDFGAPDACTPSFSAKACAGEFRLPWHRSAGNSTRPVNFASKKHYRGLNVLSLWAAADDKGYVPGTWGTYRQWSEAGAQVRKGEKASYVARKSPSRPTRTATTKPIPACSRARRRFLLPNRSTATPPLPCPSRWRIPWSRSNVPRPSSPQPARSFITAAAALSIGARPTTSTCPRARPSEARRPAPRLKLHELTHWSGAESRCNRQFGKRFGDDAYAIEGACRGTRRSLSLRGSRDHRRTPRRSCAVPRQLAQVMLTLP